VKELHIKHVKL